MIIIKNFKIFLKSLSYIYKKRQAPLLMFISIKPQNNTNLIPTI
ncbi:hypothetical protein BBU94A_AD25 (plasmid) [Borreliella burgdorferi 94a]|nr:hypothetical protein BBU94A_AD25 [Borreliella burgdorferi 94a]